MFSQKRLSIILSPLLANVNLNEFDRWIEERGQRAKRDLPNRKRNYRKGIRVYSNEHVYLKKKTELKPMYIVRYADNFKIFKTTSMWLAERLKLPISTEKHKVTNLKKEYFDFLGFKLKARNKGKSVCQKRKFLIRQSKPKKRN